MTSLTQKLQLKPGQQLVLINPPQDYLPVIARDADRIGIITGPAGINPDGVLLFINNLADIAHFSSEAIHLVRPGGLLWLAYPKGTSGVKTDVNRDRLWEALKPTGWRPVRQVAIDEVWSAMRFRPEEEVGK
jgi:hypothetical protein